MWEFYYSLVGYHGMQLWTNYDIFINDAIFTQKRSPKEKDRFCEGKD
jgi:hypothetical protein